MFRPLRLLPLLGLLLSLPASAQPTASADGPFVFGAVHTFRSQVLGQERTLNVYLPEGYADSTLRYPVIYVLDGSWNEDFPHIAGLAQFMNMYDLLPRSIVVGIANVDRYHDFTFPSRNDSDRVRLPTSGGSAAFIDFLQREVQPFVEQHYRTAGPRTFIGQSLGGLLGVEVLFRRPDLFDRYILVSPSLWWDNDSLADAADAWAARHATLPKQVFVALGTEGDDMQRGTDKLVGAFRAHTHAPFTWWYVPFPEESHATLLHRAVYKAFELMGKPAPAK